MSDELRQIASDNTILETRIGSQLYGTSTPTSDTDYAGIFMPDDNYVYGLGKVEEVEFDVKAKRADGKNAPDAVDRKLYEFRRFCKLAMDNNPNIVEILFANDANIVRRMEPFASNLLNNTEMFIHKGLYDRYVGYAFAQKKQMIIKTDHFSALEEAYEILCNEDDLKSMGELKGYSVFKVKNRHLCVGDMNIEVGVFVKKAREMVRKRIESATSRKDLIRKYGYDTKFGSHLIRLLLEGIELLNTGRIVFPLAYADRILDVKNGKYSVDAVIKMAEELETESRAAKENTKLQAKAPFNKINKFVIEQVKLFLNRKG